MNYETFINLSTALVDYTNRNRNAFIDFDHCISCNLLDFEKVDYFSDLKDLYLRSRPCKKQYLRYIKPEIFVCALIVTKYPNVTFENATGDRVKLSFLMSGRYVHKTDSELLAKAKALHTFMMHI